jgi:hypothetical protein
MPIAKSDENLLKFLIVAGSGNQTHYLPAQHFIVIKVSCALTTATTGRLTKRVYVLVH